MSRVFIVTLGVAISLLSTACAGAELSGPERAVTLATTACGDASGTSGAGVVVEDGWILASGHVVAGADTVTVSGSFGEETGEIILFDAEADLALLRVPTVRAPLLELAASSRGQIVELGGGGPSGSVEASILRPVEVRIEAVRSTERVSRIGYEIDVRVELGDSGGGAYDADDRLVGVVFGRTLEETERSFIVGYEAVEQLLEAERTGSWTCDHGTSQIQRDS